MKVDQCNIEIVRCNCGNRRFKGGARAALVTAEVLKHCLKVHRDERLIFDYEDSQSRRRFKSVQSTTPSFRLTRLCN